MKRLRLGRFGSRFAVILSGEMIQSLFHFVLNVVLVRELSAHDYGLFAIVFTIGAVGITYIRALCAVPATLFLARGIGRGAERGYDVAFGSGAVLVAALMGLAVSVVLMPTLGYSAFAGGVFVALYAFRSYLRIVLLARAASRIAGLSDIAYAASGLLLGALLIHGGGIGLLEHAFVAVASAHAIGIAIALAALRQPVRLSFRPSMRRRYLAIWPTLAWSLVGITTINVQAQGLTLLFALIAGPAAYAPIAATLVLFAPLRIPTNALTNMVLPEITGLLAGSQLRKARRLVVGSTALIGLGCLTYGAIMWTALPVIETQLFKGRFAHEPMNMIGLGVWTVITASLLYAIPRAFLEAAADFRIIAHGALISGAVGFLIMIPILLLQEVPAWALLGLLASELTTAWWSAKSFRGRLRSLREATAEASLATPPFAPARG
ncbi:hypothetical protein [Methylobacterium nigriterrae]|uniref:hypothetical protein n=1 Tax=Methylobacterium nigriterrae TaxID=3127512 RepID=UPI0030132E2F